MAITQSSRVKTGLIPKACFHQIAGAVVCLAGLFAAALTARFPDLPVADERQLADPVSRGRFVARVFAHHRARL